MAKDAYKRMKSISNNRKLSLMIKFHLLKTFIWSILTYGCESWTFTADTRHNIAAAEMWFLRRILRVSYVDRVTIQEVLEQAGIERQLLQIFDRWQLLKHIIRKEVLEELSLSGKINGKRARGRQRKHFLKNFNLGSARNIWNLARNRLEWQKIVRRTPER